MEELIKGIITYINSFFFVDEPHYQMILSPIFGIFMAVAYKIDLIKLTNIESEIPYIGCILTGILFSQGSNYVHDILQKLNIM